MANAESALTKYKQNGDLDVAVTGNNQSPGISQWAEYLYLKAFARQSFFDEEICRDHLRMLWTAFCLHHELLIDTASYDHYLLELWNEMCEFGDGKSEWDEFDDFDRFMGRYLA